MAKKDAGVHEVLMLGAEGGSLSLLGRLTEDRRWQFQVVCDETTLAGFLPDEFCEEQLFKQSAWVDSWQHALSLMDRHEWHRLHPLHIHERFDARVASAYESRAGESPLLNSKWRRLLDAVAASPPGTKETSTGYSRAVDRAIILASVAHSEVSRKHTQVPYISHPVHVARLLELHGWDENVVIAGYLHDVLEDLDEKAAGVRARMRAVFQELAQAPEDSAAFARQVRDFIENSFGPGVLRLVDAVTERKKEGNEERSWLDRKVEQLRHLSTCSPRVAALKCADALHNTHSITRDMQEQTDGGRSVLERFNAPPDALLWHYGAVAGQAGDRLGTRRSLQVELESAIDDLGRQIQVACGARDLFTGQRREPVRAREIAPATSEILPAIVGREGRQIHSVDQWRRFAPPAKGDDHWKDRRSAKELARCWLHDVMPSVPSEFAAALDTCSALRGFTLATLRPEHETKLDEYGRGRQHDAVAYGLAGGRTVVVCVEAKADESFGKTIAEELASGQAKLANGKNTNIVKRIHALVLKVFGREVDAQLGALRYQLLHATAGALIESEEADIGAFIVHEFVSRSRDAKSRDAKRVETNHEDFSKFVRLLTGTPDVVPGAMYPVKLPNAPETASPRLFVGKVSTHL